MLFTTLIMVLTFGVGATISIWFESERQIVMQRSTAHIMLDAHEAYLSDGLWHSNLELITASAKKIMSLPAIDSLTILNSVGEVVLKLGQEQPEIRYSKITHSLVLEVAGEPTIVGNLSISLNEEILNQVFYERAKDLVYLFIASLLIALVAISVAIRSLTYPLEDITLALNNLTLDSGPKELPHQNRHDEVGSLARSIQVFSDRSKELYLLQDMLTSNAVKRTREVKDAHQNIRVLTETNTKFITLMTQQIRSPLTAIRGAVALCRNGMAGEQQKSALDLLELAEKNSLKLERLLNEFAEVVALDDGNLALQLEQVDLTDIIIPVILTWRPVAERKNQTLRFDNVQMLPNVQCDPDRLKQVLEICVENAIQHSPKRISIDITVEKNTKHLVIAISDTGPGIPRKLRPILFDNVNPEKTKLCENFGKGVGLGLASGLMELMGGDLFFETFAEEDQLDDKNFLPTGTTFYVQVPLAPDAISAA